MAHIFGTTSTDMLSVGIAGGYGPCDNDRSYQFATYPASQAPFGFALRWPAVGSQAAHRRSAGAMPYPARV
jgi:hypothetical protein